MKISIATEQGSRRYQEDRTVIHYPSHELLLLATVDGHGGDETAQYVQDNLATAWDALGNAKVEDKLASVVQTLEQATSNNHSGAALSIVVINKEFAKAYVAILGDAPVIIQDKDGNISVSPEHNVRSNLSEREAVTKSGGFYKDGYVFARYGGNGLQMSRALGDASLDSILNRHPEIYTVPLNSSSFVLLGTDGLFDPSHTEGTANVDAVVALVKKGKDAKTLVDRALALPTGDNVSAILVRGE